MSHEIYQWVNFAILFFGLAIILNKALGAQFKKQRADLESKMKAASAEHDAMKREFDEARQLMNSIETKIADLRFNSSREIQIESKRIEQEAEHLIEKVVQDGELKMKAEIGGMKNELQKELLQQSMTIARQALDRELGSKDAEWTSSMLQSDTDHLKRKNYAS